MSRAGQPVSSLEDLGESQTLRQGWSPEDGTLGSQPPPFLAIPPPLPIDVARTTGPQRCPLTSEAESSSWDQMLRPQAHSATSSCLMGSKSHPPSLGFLASPGHGGRSAKPVSGPAQAGTEPLSLLSPPPSSSASRHCSPEHPLPPAGPLME
ncbi:hypothetical protein P7K49_002053 [Saguinus oedipus]|uniref:Uncharacterized protein n=1 Tax=Saguinus oedipus TaxID=9490 RepID=A0ABQ9WK45_SAGOE|nr:hypothetical protein P7K49_002053 [Saguinus oedipus]